MNHLAELLPYCWQPAPTPASALIPFSNANNPRARHRLIAIGVGRLTITHIFHHSVGKPQ